MPIPGLSDVHLLSHRIYIICLHSTHVEIGSWVMSPTHYVLVMYFCFTNYPNLGGLTQYMFIISVSVGRSAGVALLGHPGSGPLVKL